MGKRIRFTADAVYETEGPGKGPRFEAGSSHEMRDDLAQRWINRGLAVEETEAEFKARQRAERQAQAEAERVAREAEAAAEAERKRLEQEAAKAAAEAAKGTPAS